MSAKDVIPDVCPICCSIKSLRLIGDTVECEVCGSSILLKDLEADSEV